MEQREHIAAPAGGPLEDRRDERDPRRQLAEANVKIRG